MDLSHNSWQCSCREKDRYKMKFLFEHEVFPCYSDLCLTHKEADGLYIDCKGKSLDSLPSCIPYDSFDKITLDFSRNNLDHVSFGAHLI